jgi:hypothetical protein
MQILTCEIQSKEALIKTKIRGGKTETTKYSTRLVRRVAK